MPTLEWMGKNKVVAYHRQVPYRVLERIPEKSVMDSHGSDCDNMIIHGDNLEALKALLPEYEGKVDCIYIDPPYNTGTEKWVYNDNVNDPRIRKWIGEVVGPEGQDFARHDKWLCMMYPRLRILRDLLSDEGFIAVSINDVELSNLGLLLDEIFGSSNRLACAPWRSEKSGGKDKTALRTGHEYIYFYGKSPSCRITLEEKSVGDLNHKDKFGKYRKGRELRKWGELHRTARTGRMHGSAFLPLMAQLHGLTKMTEQKDIGAGPPKKRKCRISSLILSTPCGKKSHTMKEYRYKGRPNVGYLMRKSETRGSLSVGIRGWTDSEQILMPLQS